VLRAASALWAGSHPRHGQIWPEPYSGLPITVWYSYQGQNLPATPERGAASLSMPLYQLRSEMIDADMRALLRHRGSAVGGVIPARVSGAREESRSSARAGIRSGILRAAATRENDKLPLQQLSLIC
jgi:hypothetical protein